MSVTPFPVTRVAEVQRDLGRPRWLVESLWTATGAGVLGGQPKAGKTWLALEMAVSVASGTPCLGAYAVADPGPVLLFLAEDSPADAHDRISGLCAHRGVNLSCLDLLLLSTPVLRLDSTIDADRLTATVETVRPRLLVLDPFVRVQSVDENSATEISRVLSGLTILKRTHDLAILVVHHVRKNASGHPGQSLRGSGDLRAWGDSNLFLRHRGDSLELSGEHRAAPALDPVALELVHEQGMPPHLELRAESPQQHSSSLHTKVIEVLRDAEPLTRSALRATLRVNNQRLGDALSQLERDDRIRHDRDGWRLSFRSRPLGVERNAQ